MKVSGYIQDAAGDQRLTGPELMAEAGRRGAVLARLKRKPGHRFVIAHGNSPQFFADLFAVWRCGGTAVCTNSGITPHELRTIVDFVEPTAVLTRDTEPGDVGAPVVDAAREATAASLDAQAADTEPAALILFTSGTTGAPKGVVLGHDAIQARLKLNQNHIGREALQSALCLLPTHFGHGLIGNCLTPLAAGGNVTLMPSPGIAGLSDMPRLIDDNAITFASSVPGIWKLGLRIASQPKRGTLRRVHVGSAPLSTELWGEICQWTGAEVVNMYGLTETSNWVAGASSAEFAPETGLMGRLWGGEAAILADDHVSSSGEGEILLSGPSLFSGYFNRPDLTEAAHHDGWYRTGDIGTIDDQGLIRLTGRARYVINLDGTKVYPEELDLLLETHPDIQEACAFGLADAAGGETVAAAIATIDGAHPDADTLRTWLAERIRPEAIPQQFFFIDAIPKTDRGKINRDTVAAACTETAK